MPCCGRTWTLGFGAGGAAFLKAFAGWRIDIAGGVGATREALMAFAGLPIDIAGGVGAPGEALDAFARFRIDIARGVEAMR